MSDRWAFTGHVIRLREGGPPQPRRDGAVAAARKERVMVVGQTNEQVDDLADRLGGDHPGLLAGRLSAQDYSPAERVARHPNVRPERTVPDLAECQVVLATAAKWATVAPAPAWPWAIVDEAYQMRSDLLLRVAGLFDRALFVGDPGQLDPFSVVDTERWTGLSWDPMSSAVAVLLNHNPRVPVHNPAGLLAAARVRRSRGL